MTCKEKLKLEHPEAVSDFFLAGCANCPQSYGYEVSKICGGDRECVTKEACRSCWKQELPEKEEELLAEPHIMDSGDRTEFSTGAVRDMRVGKGRCDLMPLDVVASIYGGDANKIFKYSSPNFSALLIKSLLSSAKCLSIFDEL